MGSAKGLIITDKQIKTNMATWTKEQIEDLRQKEKRELFCKAVNSQLMTDPKKPMADVLKDAMLIILTAFTSYPSIEDKKSTPAEDYEF